MRPLTPTYTFNGHVEFKFDGRRFRHADRKEFSEENHEDVLDHIERNVTPAFLPSVGTEFDLVVQPADARKGARKICRVNTEVDDTLDKIENRIVNAILVYEACA